MEAGPLPSSVSMRDFQELVVALSRDSGLSSSIVRELLVEELLRHPTPGCREGNVLWIERLINQWDVDLAL